MEIINSMADSNEIEIVECVYDNIKHLKSGKYIVIKDKMAGVLDERGKILLYLQPNRLYTIQQMDIFYYNVNGKKVYFRQCKQSDLLYLC